jgi:hypothetical protein
MKHLLERREILKGFCQKTCRKKTIGKMLWRWKYNTEAYCKEIGWEDVESMCISLRKNACARLF